MGYPYETASWLTNLLAESSSGTCDNFVDLAHNLASQNVARSAI